ncbi:hypothetical protein F0P96_17570 [Hymenobacter busanensis]|uniref:Uncharacterized protein n=1 Tax=Hymenobacter busanensis TaxID=2607656 RepID=A0A7L5A1Z1_9BACT|nr:hypothetical protein [Hymenobacter busanensis]KAA9327050.1 hypothetical protein F0P96_17570 [Hymenobacter busanensis]QHJ09501.1 hypothetical protein GUY19_20385 [Hymenobacter busanensis]
MALLHHFNIGQHIFCGSLAMLLGLVPMLGRKGGAVHRRFGRWFLVATAGVLVTAVLGLAVFNFRGYLVGIVLLSVYQAWSGYRAVRTRAAGPTRLDGWVAAGFLAGSVGLVLALRFIDLVWTPGIIYSTLGALVLMTLYDLARFRFVPVWRRTLWRYDHLWKMISAYFALVSAFTGTVLPQYKPYSQFGPSALGLGLVLGFGLYYALRPGWPLPVLPSAAG